MIEYKTHIEKLKEWLEQATKANAELSEDRTWCILGIDKALTRDTLKKYFDRSDLGKKYLEEYEKNTDSGKPFAFLQTDSDLIFSLHKCFAMRHCSRMMSYRDDCAQKNYHTYSAISNGLASYESFKEEADKVI